MKYIFHFSLQPLFEILYASTDILGDLFEVRAETFVNLLVKYPLFSPILNKCWPCWQTPYHQMSWKSVLQFSNVCMSPNVQINGWTDLIGVRRRAGARKFINFRRHFWPPVISYIVRNILCNYECISVLRMRSPNNSTFWKFPPDIQIQGNLRDK
jgi:hypothetical protein